MEIFRRKILLNRVIKSNDDGSLSLELKNSPNIQFILKENFDNIGIFTDYVDEVKQNTGYTSVWDFTNIEMVDVNDARPTTIELFTNYIDSGLTRDENDNIDSVCRDSNASNYVECIECLDNTLISPLGCNCIPCLNCCQYPTNDSTVVTRVQPVLGNTNTDLQYVPRDFNAWCYPTCSGSVTWTPLNTDLGVESFQLWYKKNTDSLYTIITIPPAELSNLQLFGGYLFTVGNYITFSPTALDENIRYNVKMRSIINSGTSEYSLFTNEINFCRNNTNNINSC